MPPQNKHADSSQDGASLVETEKGDANALSSTSNENPIQHTFSLAELSSSSLPTKSLDAHIKEEFERCRQAGILRSDPTAYDILRKGLPGKLGLIAQYDPHLFTHKRAAAVSSTSTGAAKLVNMEEPYNPTKFNFNKVGQGDILAYMEDYDHELHPILVNVSPLIYGHALLVPRDQKGLPQQLSSHAIGLAIQLMLSTAKDCEFAMGFNSLGAFASVNHQHLHIMHPAEWYDRAGPTRPPGRNDFPVAYASIKETMTKSYQRGNCQVDLLEWMIPCFAFHLQSGATVMSPQDASTFQPLQEAVSRFLLFLRSIKIPYNLLFLRDKKHQLRVVVTPRKPQHLYNPDDYGFNTALGVLNGMMIAMTKEAFDTFDEQRISEVMKQHVACDKEAWSAILKELRGTS